MTEPTLYPESGFLRLRIDLAYDGTNFSGWAVQPDRRTVQEEVEKALTIATQSKIETIVAGRTDAGVHATGQVIHVDVPESLNLDDLSYKLNRMLDTDVRVMKVAVVNGPFSARFSALRRHYTYKILDGNQTIPPLDRLDVAGWYRVLDVDLMNQASALMLGSHDFARTASSVKAPQLFAIFNASTGPGTLLGCSSVMSLPIHSVIQWFATWSVQLSAWQMVALAQSGSSRPWLTRFASQIAWSFQPADSPFARWTIQACCKGRF